MASSKLLALITALGQLGTVLLIFLLLPNAPIPRNRRWVGNGIVIVSYIWGIGLWMWATLVLGQLWGVWGMSAGFVLLGIGSVPLACAALLFVGEFRAVGQIVLAAATIFALRALGRWIESKAPPRIINEAATDRVTNPASSQTVLTASTPDARSQLQLQADDEVWDAYSEVLLRLGQRGAERLCVFAESELPFPKERIRVSLVSAEIFRARATAAGLRPPAGSLLGALTLLDAFVSDTELVPTQDLLEQVVSVWRAEGLAAASALLHEAPEDRRRAVLAVFSTFELEAGDGPAAQYLTLRSGHTRPGTP